MYLTRLSRNIRVQYNLIYGIPISIPIENKLGIYMTRYPNDIKGKKWTVKQLENITQAWKNDTLADGDGLRGDVRVNSDNSISVVFRYGFKWEGKLNWFYCGSFPETELNEIRSNRDKAKHSLKLGINPKTQIKVERIERQAAMEATVNNHEKKRIENLTIEDLFNAWVGFGVNRYDDNHALTLSFNKYILPALKDKPIRELKENDLLTIYREIIKNKKYRTAVRVANEFNQMLSWAEKRKPYRQLLIDGNPAGLISIKKLLPNDYSEERDRVLSSEEIKKLKTIFTDMDIAYHEAGNKYEVERPLIKETQLALWICLGTLCRIGELLKAEWSHIDFKKRLWYLPLSNVKGTSGKKQEQYIYLSNFVFKELKELNELTGNSRWIFPASNKEGHVCEKSVSKQVGDRQVKFKNRKEPLPNRVHTNSLVLGDKAWTPHDLRRTGATMMQSLKIPLDVIDRCQNHIVAGSKIRRHYLKYEYLEEKQYAWELLGERIETIINNNNIYLLKKAI